MTFKNVSMLVPYTPDGSYREKNWNWLVQRHELLMPGIEICVGDSNITPYSRAAAINSAAKKSTKDILIIVDADLIFNVTDITNAIHKLSEYEFVLPYNKIVRLSKNETNLLLNQNPFINLTEINTSESAIWTDKNSMVGGICILTKKSFKLLGGFDERFMGWGGEDNAFFKSALYTFNKHLRLDGSIYHMYHTRPHRTDDSRQKNIELLKNEYLDKEKIGTTIHTLRKKNNFL